jgi:16S rRNA C967 or C1407 C5-methylase (RsmB/RsmF family)/NOL1/NOP2/fmu family ribosome biogenesis protein
VNLPQQLLDSLKDTAGFDKKAFEKIHSSGDQITSIRINPSKPFSIQNSKFNISPIPWSSLGYYLSDRPSFTFDPLFHAGCYYVQEASSMFLEQALKHTVDMSKPLKVLDLCAAPGGKSTHIQSLISPDSLLVSNEVIRSRVNVLKDNIIKWGCPNVMITNNDPKDFARLKGFFDVIVIDAPCSGSGLFRRDPESIAEWSEKSVELCSQRQQRIVSDVLPALKGDGVLIYSTCSYSREEDEGIVDWLVKQHPIHYLPLSIHPSWGIVDTGKGYRFWPDKVKGEGFFLATFRKQDEEDSEYISRGRKKPLAASKPDLAVLEKWVDTRGYSTIRNNNDMYLWPEKLAEDFSLLLQQLKVVYSGVMAGEMKNDKLVPDHALAMNKFVRDEIGRIPLAKPEAISYLQRRPIEISASPGWQLVTYEGTPLGWVNVLPNRVNNYYPKELLILKDSEGG